MDIAGFWFRQARALRDPFDRLMAACSTATAKTSNRIVKCELFVAHGSSMTLTLGSSHLAHGVFA